MIKLSSVVADMIRVAGAAARQNREPRSANPYPKGSQEGGLWAEGWRTGRKQRDDLVLASGRGFGDAGSPLGPRCHPEGGLNTPLPDYPNG
jgi:hypothetical protein